MKINLETLCGPIAGIHGATIQGEPGFIESLWTEAPLKRQFHGSPLLIAVRPERAASVEYLVWACWLTRHEDLAPDFLPLRLWRRALGEGARTTLVLARAQGRWDILPVKDPGLPALLGERDPSGIPDGRALILADDPAATQEPPSTRLAQGLRAFVASIGEAANTTLLPERSILIRSGRKVFDLSTEAALRIFFVARASGNPKRDDQTPQLSLPPEFRPYVNLKGSLIWGAWRGEDGCGSGFVTSTSSGEKAFRSQMGIRYRNEPFGFPQLAQVLAPFLNAKAPEGEKAVTAQDMVEDPGLKRMLSRALRTMESVVARNAEVRKALETPYRLLHEYEFDHAPTLAEAGRFPDPVLLPGGHCPPRYTNRLPGGFVSFSSLLSRQRDLSMVARYSPALASDGTPRGFDALARAFGFDPTTPLELKKRRKRLTQRRIPMARSSYVPFVPEKPTSSARRAVNTAGIDAECWPMHQILEAACGYQSIAGQDLHTVYEVDRPSKLLMTLLPEVAVWAGMPWPLPEEMRLFLEGCPRLRFRLETRVSQKGLSAWHTLASMPRPDISWLRSAALTMQRTVRTLLMIAVLESERQAAKPRHARKLLVHRHARLYIAPRSGEVVADPAENAVVRRTILGANYSLRRKSAVWQSMLHKTPIPWSRRTAAVFADIQMGLCLEKFEDTRQLLFAEAGMCHQLSRVVQTAANRIAAGRRGEPVGSIESNRLARNILRAAHRLWHGADTGALAATLMAVASGALANAQDGRHIWPQIRLGLQPLDGWNVPLGPMVCLDSKGTYGGDDEESLENQEEVAGPGLTRAA